MKTIWSAWLQSAMDAKSWSQYRLADESGVKQSTISRILDGRTKHPKTSTLAILADTLQISAPHVDGAAEGGVIRISDKASPKAMEVARRWQRLPVPARADVIRYIEFVEATERRRQREPQGKKSKRAAP